MKIRLGFAGQLLFTALVAAFLIVPAVLSMLAGVTVNYFRGIRSGLTIDWLIEVFNLYADTILRSYEVALATLAITLAIGVPAAYGLYARAGRGARLVEEIITLPLAIPGLALALSSPTAASAPFAAPGCSSSRAT
jgi:putative spermidine/putrescine transport system permease protein